MIVTGGVWAGITEPSGGTRRRRRAIRMVMIWMTKAKIVNDPARCAITSIQPPPEVRGNPWSLPESCCGRVTVAAMRDPLRRTRPANLLPAAANAYLVAARTACGTRVPGPNHVDRRQAIYPTQPPTGAVLCCCACRRLPFGWMLVLRA